MTRFTEIGSVKNKFEERDHPHEIKRHESLIVLKDEFLEGLYRIDEHEYIDIIFVFDRSLKYEMKGTTLHGDYKGAFATRKPDRPSSIAVTTVKLLEVKGNTLRVIGLDALNNSPVLDIKCCDTSIFESENETNPVHASMLKSNPRIEINNLIAKRDLDSLLLKASQLHGHYCPGLAMGVMAATFAMNELKADSDGMEDLLAITETNNCFSDGVQFVTGCSFGNNGLIYKDFGKTALTLTKRNGKGIRICSKHESQQLIREAFPVFGEYYQKVVVEQDHNPEYVSKFKKVSLERAFGTLQIEFNDMFSVQQIDIHIPEYAKIDESVICASCKESVMKSRTNEKSGNNYCLECSKAEYLMLDGNGIHMK